MLLIHSVDTTEVMIEPAARWRSCAAGHVHVASSQGSTIDAYQAWAQAQEHRTNATANSI